MCLFILKKGGVIGTFIWPALFFWETISLSTLAAFKSLTKTVIFISLSCSSFCFYLTSQERRGKRVKWEGRRD